MMKKVKFNTLWVLLLSLLLAVSPVSGVLLPSGVQTAEAAARLSKTSLSVYIGSSKTLKVKGGSGFKWSSSNKKVAKVNSSGKVTGVSKGSCSIYAKKGKTKLTCFVSVDVNAAAAKKKIAVSYDQCKDYTVAILKNNNPFTVSVDATMVFYDAGGAMIETRSDFNYCFQKGADNGFNVLAPDGQ